MDILNVMTQEKNVNAKNNEFSEARLTQWR